jgi:hypothetical protein
VPNPARPDLPGDPRPTPGSHRARSKELPTTYPAHTKRTEHARAWRYRIGGRRLDRPPARRTRAMLRRLPIVVLLAAGLLLVFATPALAATGTPTLSGVIDNLRNWIVGILAGVATLFLTIDGLRYVTAGGDPGQVEKAKIALKSAAIGYALAILAPLLVSVLASIVGG